MTLYYEDEFVHLHHGRWQDASVVLAADWCEEATPEVSEREEQR